MLHCKPKIQLAKHIHDALGYLNESDELLAQHSISRDLVTRQVYLYICLRVGFVNLPGQNQFQSACRWKLYKSIPPLQAGMAQQEGSPEMQHFQLRHPQQKYHLHLPCSCGSPSGLFNSCSRDKHCGAFELPFNVMSSDTYFRIKILLTCLPALQSWHQWINFNVLILEQQASWWEGSFLLSSLSNRTRRVKINATGNIPRRPLLQTSSE